jgi:ribonuclease D
VRYLIKNYRQLKTRLENEQKLKWLMERCAQSKGNAFDKVCQIKVANFRLPKYQYNL